MASFPGSTGRLSLGRNPRHRTRRSRTFDFPPRGWIQRGLETDRVFVSVSSLTVTGLSPIRPVLVGERGEKLSSKAIELRSRVKLLSRFACARARGNLGRIFRLQPLSGQPRTDLFARPMVMIVQVADDIPKPLRPFSKRMLYRSFQLWKAPL